MQTTYHFTNLGPMHHQLNACSGWSKTNLKDAVNMGTGPWLCVFKDGEFTLAVDCTKYLIRAGFSLAYDFTQQSDKDAAKVAKAALKFRLGKTAKDELAKVLFEMETKYARQFSSTAMHVAMRLASLNPCIVAAAGCIEAVGHSPKKLNGVYSRYFYKALESAI